MFTFSFSSAFATTTYTNITVQSAKDAAYSTIEGYVSLTDYDTAEQAAILAGITVAEGLIFDAEANKGTVNVCQKATNSDGWYLDKDATSVSLNSTESVVAYIDTIVKNYKAFVDELVETGVKLAKDAKAYVKEMTAYIALYDAMFGTDTNYTTARDKITFPTAANYDNLTAAEQKALFEKYKAKLEKAAKTAVDYDATEATKAYKAANVQAVREKVAELTGAKTYSVANQAKIDAALEEAIAAINAAATVSTVDDIVEKYVGEEGYKAKVKATKGLVITEVEDGIITLLSYNTVKAVTSANISDWDELVKFIETYYNSKEIQAGEWHNAIELMNEVYKRQAIGGSYTQEEVVDTLSDFIGLTRGYVETWNPTDLSFADYRTIHINEYVKADQNEAKLAWATYNADVELATSLAQVRELQANLVKTLEGLTLKEDKAVEDAKEVALSNLEMVEKIFKSNNGVEKLYSQDAQTLIALAEEAVKAEIAALDDYDDLYATASFANIYGINVDASDTEVDGSTLPVGVKTMVAVKAALAYTNSPALNLLLTVLENEGYTKVASQGDFYAVKDATLTALMGYYIYLLNYNYDVVVNETPTPDVVSGSNYFHVESSSGYYTADYDQLGIDAINNFLKAAYTSGAQMKWSYDYLAAQLDTYKLESVYQADKLYAAFEEAMKALADNPADKTTNTKARLDKAVAARDAVFGTTERFAYGNYPWLYTDEQEDAMYAALRTLIDYQYDYEYAKDYEEEAIGYYVPEVELFYVVGKLMADNDADNKYYTKSVNEDNWCCPEDHDALLVEGDSVSAYGLFSLEDQSAISKAVANAYVAIEKAKTAAGKKEAALAGIEALKSFVPKNADRTAASYAETLEGYKILAQKFFSTYEGVTFTSVATDEYELRDEIIAAMDDEVTMTAEEVKVFLQDNPLTVRTAKTAKGNIKVTVTTDLSKLEKAGYTVSYKFYKATKKNLLKNYSLALTKSTNTYTNTKLVKGANYYKAVVVVKDAKGAVVAESQLVACKAGYRTIK